jgi:hypothetical protein
MASYRVETKLSPEEVIRQAVAYFGDEVVKLEVIEQADCCAHFEGGGGFVHVALVTGENATTVDLETREWDAYVKQFMRHIAQ